MAKDFDRQNYIHYQTINSDYQNDHRDVQNIYSHYVDYVHKGSNYPDWRQRIQQGACATTALSGALVKRTFGTSNGRLIARTVPSFPIHLTIDVASDGDLAYVPYPLPDMIGWADADNQAMSRFLSACENAQTKFQGLVVAGELKQSLDLIMFSGRELIRGMHGYLSLLKKARKGFQTGAQGRLSQRQKLSFLSENYLAAVFGWLPFVRDIDSAAQALAVDSSIARQWEIVSGFGKTTNAAVSSPLTGSNGFNALQWEWKIRYEAETTVKYYGSVYQPTNALGIYESRNFGYNLRSFAPSMWELLPFSFVVDYFTNLGDLIHNYSYGTSNILWVTRTVRQKMVGRVVEMKLLPHLLNPSIWGVEDWSLEPDSMVVESVTYSRVVTDPVNLIPTLRWKIPGVTSLKWLNLAALGAAHNSLLPFYGV